MNKAKQRSNLLPVLTAKSRLPGFSGTHAIGRVNLVAGYGDRLFETAVFDMAESLHGREGVGGHTMRYRPDTTWMPYQLLEDSESEFSEFSQWAGRIMSGNRLVDYRITRDKNDDFFVEGLVSKNGKAATWRRDVYELGSAGFNLFKLLEFLWHASNGVAVLERVEGGMLPETAVLGVKAVYEALAWKDRGPSAAVIATVSDAVINFTGSAVRPGSPNCTQIHHRDAKIHLIGSHSQDMLNPEPKLETYGFDKDGVITGGWPYGFFNY